MAEVRAGVDELDRQLVALLAERFRFMDAAARIKPQRAQVRDEARKRQVIENAGRTAESLGLAAGIAMDFWEALVEASIGYEMREWERRHAQKQATVPQPSGR